MSEEPVPDASQIEEIEDSGTTWRFDRAFLESNWRCLWGRGCQGILSEPAEHLGQGCCSVGAELDGEQEAMNIVALAAAIPAHLWQFRDAAATTGVLRFGERTNTQLVEGACIFLNRPGFAGGAGCALHLAALASGESPIDWKPSVCWQLPIRVEWTEGSPGGEIATVRRWHKQDWGDPHEQPCWWCTEAPEAYSSEDRVVDSLDEELSALLPASVHVELRRRLRGDTSSPGNGTIG